MSKEKINISEKELDRDIINMSLPEIDWSEPPTGYPENFTKDSIERRKKSASNTSE